MKHLIIPSLLLALSTAWTRGASVPLETTPRTPAAMGVVNVQKDANENTVGKIEVEHLAPARELRDDLNVYVAWVRPVGDSEWQNVGQLSIDNSRKGTLEVRVPHDQFELSVSAESDSRANNPSEFIVMQARVDSRTAS